MNSLKHTMQLIQSIYSWSEQERYRLTQDLHDTVLQEQIILYREIVKLLEIERLPLFIQQKLDELARGMLELIEELRYFCREARPPYMLQTDFKKALEQLIDTFHLRSNIEILFQIKLQQYKFNEELSLHLFRIIQELLANANKHSNASQIELNIYENNQSIHIDYIDDGVGIEKITTKMLAEHMGISGIYYRVASLGGNVAFQTNSAKGLEVKIVIPYPHNTK